MSVKDRRELLKGLAVGSVGSVWSVPVVSSVLLPSHGGASPVVNAKTSLPCLTTDDVTFEILDCFCLISDSQNAVDECLAGFGFRHGGDCPEVALPFPQCE
jgi:hypothetical protein